MLLQVGELARHTGLTVRTLHHYDEIGLLRPSGRSESGYRLYSQADVARLHGIQALRHLGLALADIGAMLEGEGAAPALIIEQQMLALDHQITHATELRGRLALIQNKLEQGSEPTMAQWLESLALMATYGKYFSAAELKGIFANLKQTEREWAALMQGARAVMDAGLAPDSPEAQRLAHSWMAVVLCWMDGNFELVDRWGEMFRQETWAHGRDGAPPSDMMAFMNRAIELRMGLLGKYLSLEEIRRFRHVAPQRWRELGDSVQRLQREGASPAGAPAQAVFRQWLELLDHAVGGDAAVRMKLLRAHASEPLLAAGSPLPPEARVFLRACMQQALDPHAT